MMNMFNNFGSPIIGDAITLPIAPHSWTYLFLPDHIAMTVNRFAICFFSILFLILLFKHFMSLGSANICAVLMFFTPSFFWHTANHQFQATLLYFALLLLIQYHFNKSDRYILYILYFIIHVIMLFSVSYNITILIIFFLIANQIFLSNFKFERNMLASIIIVLCSILFCYPDISSFYKLLSESLRFDIIYTGSFFMPRSITNISFDSVLEILNNWVKNVLLDTFNVKTLLLSVVGKFPQKRFPSMSVANYISLPLIIAMLIGLITMCKTKVNKKFFYRVFILGLGPLIIVFFLLVFKNILWSIPLLKSTDITRIFWVSNVFLMIAVGTGLDSFIKGIWQLKHYLYFFLHILGIIIIYIFLIDWKDIETSYKVPIYVLLFIFLTYLLIQFIAIRYKVKINISKKITSKIFFFLISMTVVSASLVMIYHILGYEDFSKCNRDSFYFMNAERAVFQPRSLIKHIKPFNRIAVGIPSIFGFEQKINIDFVLGSSSRSTLINKNIARYLYLQGLIQIDSWPPAYHLKLPRNPIQFKKLGIRYIIHEQHVSPLEEWGWKLIKKDFNSIRNIELYLYENQEITPIYIMLENDIKFIKSEDITFKGNSVHLKIPALTRERELIATFVAIPGWKAIVDNTQRDISTGDDPFIRVKIKPGDKHLIIKYEPYTILQMFMYMIGALIILNIFWLIQRKQITSS